MQFIHHPDRAVVRLAGALCVDAVEELVDTVDMLCRVYFYSLIEIRIGSCGGTSAALGAYCDALARWRDAGVRVRTRAVTVAESAAAIVLSLGDERIAEPRAQVLYHNFRVVEPGSLTADGSASVCARLSRLQRTSTARNARSRWFRWSLTLSHTYRRRCGVFGKFSHCGGFLRWTVCVTLPHLPPAVPASADVPWRDAFGVALLPLHAFLRAHGLDGSVGTAAACAGSALRQCALVARLLGLRATAATDRRPAAFELLLRSHAGRFEPSARGDSDGGA